MAHKKGSVFTAMLKENIRCLCQACSKHGTGLEITQNMTACLYSTATCGCAVHWNLPASHPQFSFPCSSTIMYKTHYHRNEEGGAQIRMSFDSLSSLLPKQTVTANGRSTLNSLLLTPFLTQTYSLIPWGDPVCVLDEAKIGRNKWL